MINKRFITSAIFISLFISVAGGLFKLLHWQGANILLIVGLGTLAMCHFMLGFNPEIKNPKAKWLNYNRNFSIATLVMGILFHLMHWEGSRLMIYIGGISLIAGVALQVIMGEPEEEEK